MGKVIITFRCISIHYCLYTPVDFLAIPDFKYFIVLTSHPSGSEIPIFWHTEVYITFPILALSNGNEIKFFQCNHMSWYWVWKLWLHKVFSENIESDFLWYQRESVFRFYSLFKAKSFFPAGYLRNFKVILLSVGSWCQT